MENLFSNTPKGFKKTIYISIAAHIIAIAAVVLFVGGSQKKVFFTPVYTVSLVEPARSPVKKKTKKAPVRKVKKKRAVKKTVIKKKAVKKPPVALKKKKTNEKELSTAISKIREKVRVSEEQKLIASKIEAIKERAAAEERARRLASIRGSIKEAARAEPPPAASTTGLRAESLEIKYKAYFSLIRDHVQRNWIVPESFDNEKVSVIVSIRIGRNGDLIKSWVEKGSGSRQFDDSLLKAVKKASPFPPLPQDFTEDILETGLRFCPRCD